MRLQPNQIWTSIEIYSNWFFFVICFHFRFHSVIFCIGYLKFSLDSWWKLENFRKFSRLLKFHESLLKFFKLNFKRKSYLKYLQDFLHCEKKFHHLFYQKMVKVLYGNKFSCNEIFFLIRKFLTSFWSILKVFYGNWISIPLIKSLNLGGCLKNRSNQSERFCEEVNFFKHFNCRFKAVA